MNKYSVFYLTFTVITGGIAYCASSKLVTGIFVVLFCLNFIYFLTFFNATDEEIKDAERRVTGEGDNKDSDKN